MNSDSTTTVELSDQLAQQARDLIRQLDDLSQVAKTAAKLLKEATSPDDAAAAMAAIQKLDKLELPPTPLIAAVRDLLNRSRQHIAEEDKRLRFTFGKSLREEAAKAGVECSLLTTEPPEFRLGLLTVAVDFARRAATLRYARNDLIKVAAKAETIVEGYRRQLALLEGKDFSAEVYFQHLLHAYQSRLHRIGQPLGSRVDIIDLLADLAFQLQSQRFMEDPVRENFTTYSRVQLAYDLARLRRHGRLSHQGLRLSLGSATGGSTKQKSRVLYLEDDRGSGQYFLSIRFAREGDPE